MISAGSKMNPEHYTHVNNRLSMLSKGFVLFSSFTILMLCVIVVNVHSHNTHVIILSLQKKAADAFSMFGSDIYKHGKMDSIQVAASESKSDGKTDSNPLHLCISLAISNSSLTLTKHDSQYLFFVRLG